MNTNGLNSFDAILYINLEHRVDRKDEILKQLQKGGALDEKIFRIEAHLDPLNGHRGCCISHIKALNFAIENQFNSVLILEDDFVFTHTQTEIDQYINTFSAHFKSNWDVFLLSANVIDYENTTHPTIKKVVCAQTAHSYALNSHYYTPLKECFKFALSLMESDIFAVQTTENLHCLDHVWKILQPTAQWFIGSTPIGRQDASYSDIGLYHIKRLDNYYYP